MDNFHYELTTHSQIKHKAKYYLVTGIVLIFVILFMIWYRSYEFGKMAVLFSMFFGAAGSMYNKKKKKYAQEELFWDSGNLYYVAVPYDQYVDLNETKYQRMEKKYHIRSVRKIKASSSKVVIYGDILCTTTNNINNQISMRESMLTILTIPNHFENWDHFVNSLERLQ